MSYQRSLSYSPSYLLLNNWKDESIWITTGIPIPNPQLNGFIPYPFSIRNLYIGKHGILNFTLSASNLSVSSAYLTLNNSVVIESMQGNLSIIEPPYSPYLLILFSINSTFQIKLTSNTSIISINKTSLLINASLPIYVLSNITHLVKKSEIDFVIPKGKTFIEISVNAKPNENVSQLLSINFDRVKEWLNKSKIPNGLPKVLLNEYYLSLLLLKDDQNPYLGTFAASPSPIYLYSWVRDSAFSAIALQEAGHYESALKYWLWMSKAEQIQPGVWYTRYDFYNGKPDISFGIPELDSIGLYQIGIYQFYNLTKNMTFLREVLRTLNLSLLYEIKEINSSKFHLLPQDLSVWEDRSAYHFWTESLDDLGLFDSAKIYEVLGLNYSLISREEYVLNQSIIKYFWYNNTYFASALGTSVIYENGKSVTTLSLEPPAIDSATLLPIDMGYLPVNSAYAASNFNTVINKLTVNGGLSRFPDDLYHYSEYLYDSSGPSPPWIISTLFEALYYEQRGNYAHALNLLYWAYDHSQHGLLPEAIDPNYGNPLPTTSPLTWSSAMFIISSLSYKPNIVVNSPLFLPIITVIILIIVIIIITIFRKRSAH
ncbi:glycoside hydrolase [Sulfolobus sp. A20-N-F6]|uniref:glycoside hydrolase family 15 protein n=1 Tax=Saccharolobus sp. A20 TaxID=1891280 RepID=UPI0012EAC951|nr:glycoside hydrolase [Sulfolobus sp. B5]TRM80557.1 glycoside hydrolase [Sulfolobus sp. D5]TRM83252.1 glycoside hydrolase [Sulfolobus sp. A20-N-F6]TRM88475.1 glycoside hydrolase [Sulfolobus sp. C3]